MPTMNKQRRTADARMRSSSRGLAGAGGMVGTVAKQPLAAGCGHFDHPTVRTNGELKVNVILLIMGRQPEICRALLALQTYQIRDQRIVIALRHLFDHIRWHG